MVGDILIAAVDCLKGFPDATPGISWVLKCPGLHRASAAPFPKRLWKDSKNFGKDLKQIYQGTDDVKVEKAHTDAAVEWDRKYPSISPLLRRAWQDIDVVLCLPTSRHAYGGYH